jgi:hypothetical protein
VPGYVRPPRGTLGSGGWKTTARSAKDLQAVKWALSPAVTAKEAPFAAS